ncbi:hypothetical protein [Collinsella sp. HCP28S3_H5]|uniref:hypothetical protein n=1 Tax=unclassified Collinsella TaxID=2637548 RepID=UPI003F8A010D
MANLVEYVKTVWENGKTALNAARMNNMEQGISNCATQINNLGDSVSPICKWSNSFSFDLKTDSNFALVLSANDSEQLTPFLVWRSGDSVTHTNLPSGYSVKRDGNTITVSRSQGATFIAYRYSLG